MANLLNVLARGGLLVLDVAHAEAAPTRGHRAYVGRDTIRAWELEALPTGCPRHEHSNEFLELGNQPIPHCAYPVRSTPTEVPNTSYYRKQVSVGALWPADEETAALCGVRFDPNYGGEYPHLVKGAAKKGREKDGDK